MADLHERLRRYRPGGPPADLRARIVPPPESGRAWPWVAAAAGLLAATILLREQVRVQVDAIYDPPHDSRQAAIEQLTATLGGSEEARRLAETIALQDQVRAERAASSRQETQ